MLHSIFYSVDHMPIEVVQPEVILTEEIMKNDVDRDTPGDATTDDDTVENTDSTNLPLLIVTYPLYVSPSRLCPFYLNIFSLLLIEAVLLRGM